MNCLSEWRNRLTLTKQQASEALGISLKSYCELERGYRYDNGEKTSIDLRTRLACSAIENGLKPINVKFEG